MMKPETAEASTVLIKREVGYAWSYSFEAGPSGDRQKTYVGGNEDTLLRALVQLRKAKIEILELSQASLEELLKLPPFEGFSQKDSEDAEKIPTDTGK